MTLSFEKFEGTGNDFVLVYNKRMSAALAQSLCDRHTGVGADGVLVVTTNSENTGNPILTIYNADGSVPQMCGNGLRCVALFLKEQLPSLGNEFTVETDAGPRHCVVGNGEVTIDMGDVRSLGKKTIVANGESVDLHVATAGNPHAIRFGEFDDAMVRRLGLSIATHPEFAGGTNAEFASVSGNAIRLVVWERGVGLTQACGTGACATAVAAWDEGLIARDVEAHVDLPGGRLHIRNNGARVTMRGPARHVFSGTFRD